MTLICIYWENSLKYAQVGISAPSNPEELTQ